MSINITLVYFFKFGDFLKSKIKANAYLLYVF